MGVEAAGFLEGGQQVEKVHKHLTALREEKRFTALKSARRQRRAPARLDGHIDCKSQQLVASIPYKWEVLYNTQYFRSGRQECLSVPKHLA